MNFDEIENLIKFNGNNPFLVSRGQIITYSEVSHAIANIPNELCFCEGKFVSVIAPQGMYLKDFVILLLSLLRLNAKVLIISPKETPQRIVNQISKIPVSSIMLFDNYSHLAPELKNELQTFYNTTTIEFSKLFSPYLSNTYLTVIPAESQCVLPNHPYIIILTSGSTGISKKVVLSIQNFLVNAQYSNKNIRFTDTDTWLLSLPVFHVSGISIIFRAIVGSARVYIPDDNQILYSDNFPEEVTHISVVSTILWRIINSNSFVLKEKMKKLKAVLVGGGPIPGGLVKTAHEYGWRVYTTYGMTEMASQITTTCENDTLEHLLTSGKPLIPGSVKLNDKGEIYVSGPTRFEGYLEDGKLKTPFDEEGWFGTGDLGKWTEDGYLCVLGRKDNMFICAGENIYPEEIESCILDSGCVRRVIVIPQKNDEYGMVPTAYLDFEENKTEAELLNYLKTKLPPIKIPKKFYPFPDALKTPDLKISRTVFIDHINRKR